MKKFYALLFALVVLCCIFCSAQTRNPGLDVSRTNIWRFGFYSTFGANDVPGLDFSSGSPVVINSGNTSLLSGATTICNTTGQLQLYGAYQSMYDSTNGLLSNAGVVGDSGWIGISPCNIAIPMPNSPNLIYYFSAQVTLKYTVVDMNLNSGKGQAILRNIELEPYPVESKLAAVHHCNGSDVWIVGHRWQTNTFYAYLLTDTGIITTPVYSSIGPIHNATGAWQGGKIKFSPNGNKLFFGAFGSVPQVPYLFDFDKSTGVISNPVPLQPDTGSVGGCFSPDCSKIYVSTGEGYIFQYDLNAGSGAAIAASKKQVFHVFNSISNTQLGLDGKIYVLPAGNPHRKYLTVINYPNLLDTLCNVQLNAIYLNGGQGTGLHLMNTVESYFYTGSSAYPCYGDTVTNVSAINGKDDIALSVAPNPFSDYTFIEVRGIDVREKMEYQLCDIAGRVCDAQITESDWWDGKRLIFHRARLPTGIYLLTVKTLYQSRTIKLSIF